MKKMIIFMFFLSAMGSANSAESKNLLKNGDFERGGIRWNGTRHIRYETPDKINRICVLELGDNESSRIEQVIKVRKEEKLTVRLKAKTSQDENAEFTISLGWEGSITVSTRRLSKKNEWEEFEFNFGVPRDKTLGKFVISARGNSGHIALDDIVMTETSKLSNDKETLRAKSIKVRKNK